MEPWFEQNTASPPAGETLWVLQVSDSHLYADPQRSLLGINTLDSLREVLDLGMRSLSRKPDLVVATGDLVHDASIAGYTRLAGELGRLGVPVYCLPGNHDKPSTMTACLEESTVSTTGVVDTDYWRIVMLDSTIPDEEGGRLSAAELERLAHALAATDKHVLLCLHHQPVPVGSAWIDRMALQNGDEFFHLIGQHKGVKGIIWGHVHQAYDGVRNGIKLFATPSTCVQFAPGLADFKVDDTPPGCRLLALKANGDISSRVLSIASMPAGADLGSAGY